MFALLAYTGSNTTPTANFDLTAVPDPDYSQRNGHYIFTEPYGMRYAVAQSTTMTDARLLTPTFAALNADGLRITDFQDASGVSGAPTLIEQWRPAPAMLPMNEELQFQASCTAAAEDQYGLLWLVSSNFNPNIPSGPLMTFEATTGSFTPTANQWSGPQPMVLNNNPRGGVYVVVRATCQQAGDTLAFRIVFPRNPAYRGRRMRPGWVAQDAVGSFSDVLTQVNPYHLGSWGAFHTFELPQVEVFATTSAPMTPVFRLRCIYIGADVALLDQYNRENSVA